jgi:hypothetical protein
MRQTELIFSSIASLTSFITVDPRPLDVWRLDRFSR